MPTWKEQCTALEDAFRSLPIKRPKKANAIPYDLLIPAMGRQLILMTPSRPPQTVVPKIALRNLNQSSAQIIKVLDSLSSDELSALNHGSMGLQELTIRLKVLHKVTAKPVVKRPPGRPTKIQPAKITKVVAQHYYRLTGRKPAVSKNLHGVAGGCFLELVQKVFMILGVEASALSQAEKISRNWPK